VPPSSDLLPADPAPADPAPADPPAAATSRHVADARTVLAPGGGRAWPGVLGEILVAITAAVLSVWLSRTIDVNPLDRISQVSGLAALALRYCLLGGLVLAVLLLAAQVARPAVFRVVSGLACAATAGLITGFIAGGVVVALHGTAWPIFANLGDAHQLIEWADQLRAGQAMPASYPPLAIHLMAWLGELTGQTSAEALRTLQILGTALFGPAAYLAWRLLLSPPWALGIGLTAALPLIDAYKPYTHIVLVILLPVVVTFLRTLRRAASVSLTRILLAGTGFGAACGVLFLTYSGWFVWSAPGVLAAVLVIFPWRRGSLRGVMLLGATGAVFVATAFPHLVGIVRATGAKDRYFYFDTSTEPAYIAMWRSDTLANISPWPPLGELAGVGVFTVLLVVGLGAAVALAGRRTVVIALCCCMISAWILRFWFAAQVYATQAVQLYPRTTIEILYCLLLLSGFAVYFAVQRFSRQTAPATNDSAPIRRRTVLPAAGPVVGLISAVLLFGLFAASSVSDRYMPRGDNSSGFLTYVSHYVRQENGKCPDYTAPDSCLPDGGAVVQRRDSGG
jgi:hypothetical protein